MIDLKKSFIYPDSYIDLNQRFHSKELYEIFEKKILFRINASPNNPYGIKQPNGLLIYGPPCNGKTFLAKQFAQLTKLPYIIINRYDISEIGNKHIDKLVFEFISSVREYAPCVIILENIESIIPNRKQLINNEGYAYVMSIMSIIRTCGEKGIYIFATTSKPTEVDPQLVMNGYLNELFYTPYPNMEQRMFIVKQLMESKPCSEDINYELIAQKSDNYTIGDLVSLIEEIAINSAFSHTYINNDIVRLTLEEFRHPMTSLEKKQYDEIHSLLEKKNEQTSNKNIGFK